MKISSPEEMSDLGSKLGAKLKAGDLILLNGSLGAGKTLLVQGIGSALGFSGITSPTFVISRIHKGDPSLIHVDVYRLLEDGKASLYLDDLDLDSEREQAVTVIEWGGAESARLSDERLEIDIDRTGDERLISFRAIGLRWAGFAL
ncbi:MAG: tRNA (adenosine(37)-N6)-threonylcarbamoyltransferase complex ATPase subunit type 1 TsaE [Candidatus Planktophila sp.]